MRVSPVYSGGTASLNLPKSYHYAYSIGNRQGSESGKRVWRWTGGTESLSSGGKTRCITTFIVFFFCFVLFLVISILFLTGVLRLLVILSFSCLHWDYRQETSLNLTYCSKTPALRIRGRLIDAKYNLPDSSESKLILAPQSLMQILNPQECSS